MVGWKYADYIGVEQGFVDVYSEEVDKDSERWKQFIPHENMKELLQKLMKTLERGNKDDEKPIWLTGAYGTGKTFASFVVKHLLEDDIAEVEKYFKNSMNIEAIGGLWEKFKAIRSKKPILVVYKSGSGHVDNPRRFLMEIQKGVTDELRRHSYHQFSHTMVDDIIEKFDSGVISLDNLFAKYRGEFLTFDEPRQVFEALRNSTQNDNDLEIAEKLAKILSEEGIYVNDDPSSVKKWLGDVIERNDLGAIVFIWDEFTEYLNKSRSFDTVQEVAQYSAEIPFYLFLVTHRAPTQFTSIDESQRAKIMDRFHVVRLEMKEITAFNLMARAIEIKPATADEWKDQSRRLWLQVEKVADAMESAGIPDVEKEDMEKLVPMHPYTAYLLAHISNLYVSSQRSLFRYLKSKEKGGFSDFIEKYPEDGWYWITSDRLWDYFFDSPDELIKQNDGAMQVINYARNAIQSDLLSGDEVIVVKAVCLLLALNYFESGAGSAWHKPLLSNLKLMFAGSPLDKTLGNLVEGLESKQILHANEYNGDKEFILPGRHIPEELRNAAQNFVNSNHTFYGVLTRDGGKVNNVGYNTKLKNKILSLTGPDLLRFDVKVQPFQSPRFTLSPIEGLLRPYQIGVIVVPVFDDADREKAIEKAKEIATKKTAILVSLVPLNEENWKECKKYANDWYCYEEMKETSQANYARMKTEEIMNSWFDKIATGDFMVFIGSREPHIVRGIEKVKQELKNLRTELFPAGPEKIDTTATLYDKPSYGKSIASYVLEPPTKIPSPYKELIQKLQRDHVWPVDLSTVQSNHPLKRMQDLVDQIMEERNFDVPLIEVWKKLQEPPFGLMPSPIGLFLFACVMKKYTQGYYIYDGKTTQELNANRMADLLTKVVKHDRGCEDLVIKRLTKEAQDFCKVMRETFSLTEPESATPEEVRKSLNGRISAMHYPLWILEFDPDLHSYDSETFRLLISNLQAFIFAEEVPDDEQLRAITHVLEGPIGQCMAKSFTKEHMNRCFVQFLTSLDVDISSRMQKVGLEPNEVRDILAYLLKEDASKWRQEEVLKKLPLVKMALLSIEALKSVCDSRIKRLDDAASTFENKFQNRFSFEIYRKVCTAEGLTELSRAFEVLQEILELPENLNKSDALKITESDIVSVIQNAFDIRTYLDNPSRVIRVLASTLVNQELDEREAKEVSEKLVGLLDGTAFKNLKEEQLCELISKVIADLTKNKLSTEIQEKWRSLTATLTVENWEEKHKMPIQWVMDDDILRSCIKDMRVLHDLSEDELHSVLSILEERGADLRKLSDENYLLSKYVATVMPDHLGILGDPDSMRQLRDYIYGRMQNKKPAEWPDFISLVQGLAKDWLQERYKDAVAQKLQRKLMQMGAEELKSLIANEIENNTELGLALYECMRRKEGAQID